MKTLILFVLFCAASSAQQVRWAATTGNVSQTGSTYTATIQQPATGMPQIWLDQIVVYCSVACTVTQSANGTAASATAGTVTPVLPTPLQTVVPVNFYTASNVGSGTTQGGIVNLPATATVILCLSPQCGNGAQVAIPAGSTANNYSVQINAITGTSNITFYGRAQ